MTNAPDEVTRIMNKMINENPRLREMFSSVMGTQASYRYYENERGDRFFYTTKKINHKGNERYVSGIYRYRKTKDDYKLLKSSKAGNAKKKDAIARAKRLLEEDNAYQK